MKRKRNGSRESDDRCYVDDFTLNKLKQIFPTLPSGRMYRGRCWLRTPYDEHNSQSPRHFVLGPGFSPKAMHSSSESSSGTESDSGSSSKSSSEDEKTTRRVSAHKISNLKKDESKQPQNLVVSGMDVVKKIEQVGTAKGEPDGLVKIVDCGEVSKKKIHDLVGTEKGKKKKTGKAPTSENDSDGPAIGRHRKSLNDKRKKRKRRYSSSDKLINNGHGTGSKSDKTATQHPYSDNSSKSRIPTPIPKRSKIISPRPSSKPSASNHGRDASRNSSPNGAPTHIRIGHGFTEKYHSARTYHTPSPEHAPGYGEPSASNHGRDASRNSSPIGAPTRIRKERGFTEKYHSARTYHTPSPEPAPGYGGKYFSERNRDKYTNYRPRRYDRSRPLSPLRYRSRRSRSRSISRSPGGYRHRGRDRTRSPSPRDKPLVASERLSSHLGSHVDDRHGSDKGRRRSRSRSRGTYRSRSPDVAPKKRR